MKINGVNPSKVINLYSDHKKTIEKKERVQNGDIVQISSLGKSLSSYSLDDKFVSSKEKIEKLTNEVKNGTYNIDSKLIAAKIMEEMKI
ncbi:flagellar biosynthesis anti-sigma factor FlgM [Clostridium sp. P21]|uniref:Flagellar biosynthesis anti-sigma factor FlgM n=1 Tax=Clostridium muellerianum TaxID=2716538 RepID=A0A7Y0EDA6_9CLOT|nr:flagellar biosynthesis anti-sigma factor FlgM [Clostridium muellerianum]NMM61266.1 flagellar biosynthesis anti-sigma factor FlgM [Clostridium muellerianum]